jgi:GNAT superfamily N-acetyltransferase
LRPGDLGAIVRLHGLIYASEHGLDITFEPYVAKPLADFILAGPDAGRLWIAEAGGEVTGSIAAVMHADGTAQLRWFLLVPEARGSGLGRHMLETALRYCRQRGASAVYLWTFAELHAAISLYERLGFRATERVSHHVWGAERMEIRMELGLSGEPQPGGPTV